MDTTSSTMMRQGLGALSLMSFSFRSRPQISPIFRARQSAQFAANFRQNKRWRFSAASENAAVSRKRTGVYSPWFVYSGSILLFSGAGILAYHNSQPFRHTVLAAVRCSRVARAAVLGIIDYKVTLSKSYASEEEQLVAFSQCHKRSALRVLKALLANGGGHIYQVGTALVVRRCVTTGMDIYHATSRLQDQCDPTPYEDVEALFLSDMGQSISDLFDDFEPNPIGVASLAQVHVGHHRESGKKVAVKLQHPHLAEFCDVDMEMVEVTLGWIKKIFPEFELTWLGEEMRTNLPRELDFSNEAANAAKTLKKFENTRTSLYIPKVISADKRVLIMEYIQGGRVDDLEFLADCNIDRNKVALELSRIFNKMVFIDGWFHADPHPGNLLIRPAPHFSKSPYNFEIVLLDHGLYFDIDDDLRINYSRFWLSLMAPGTPKTSADRRRYAQLVGNIGPDLYPVFEAAITGRAALEGTWNSDGSESQITYKKASGMLSVTAQSVEEMEVMRNAVVNRKGLLVSVFDVLRRVPRRVLMVLKLNDLTRYANGIQLCEMQPPMNYHRNLDNSLMTTHSNIRIFLIMAKYCLLSVWRSDQRRLIDVMRDRGLLSFGLLREYFGCWWKYQRGYTSLAVIESLMDFQAFAVKSKAWLRGLLSRGLKGAHQAAAGLV
uniref:Putative ABC1-domain-containing protein n=1 Tax=Moniliophthora roreri TaxID=221103 RepID=A0A0W0FH10_MONRR